MPKKLAMGWNKDDQDFIEILKQYELSNAFDNYPRDELWHEISMKANLKAVCCRKKWHSIKYTYIKLKHMISIGRVTESMVLSNKKTWRYLDGSLDFLDRYLSKIPDNRLPNSVHYFFASMFGYETDKSTPSVDAVKLIKLEKERGIIEVIQEYEQETGTEPMCILPNTEQTTEVDSNDNNSNNVELVAPMHQVILPAGDFTYVSSSTTQPITNDPIGDMPTIQRVNNIIKKMKNEAEVEYRRIQPKKSTEDLSRKSATQNTKNEGNLNLAHFLVKYRNANIDSEHPGDLKEYMGDLAEVLCNRLAPPKRKEFLSQIDLIVSEMLEG